MKFEATTIEKRNMIVGDSIEKYEGKEINAFIYKNSKNNFPNNIKYLEFKTLHNSPVIFIRSDGETTLEEYAGVKSRYLVLEFSNSVKGLYGAECKMLDLGVIMKIITPTKESNDDDEW